MPGQLMAEISTTAARGIAMPATSTNARKVSSGDAGSKLCGS
jgi:hypothetical protein